MKLVIIILLVLGLLYGLSIVFANKTTPKPDDAFSSLRSSLGSNGDSLSDRFGPGFDFKSVSDAHASAKARTITVPHGQTLNIRINASSSMQRMKFVGARPACKIVYDDNDRSLDTKTGKRKIAPQEEDADLKNTIAMTKAGGILEVTCKSNAQDCVLTVK
jgi:hypothetical protein